MALADSGILPAALQPPVQDAEHRREGTVTPLGDGLGKLLRPRSPDGERAPTVSYCASQLCLSAGYFGDLVRETTGDTATAFIHRYVIRRANELLRAGNSISSTAYDLGFQNPSHFSRVYKKITGIPPSDFR